MSLLKFLLDNGEYTAVLKDDEYSKEQIRETMIHKIHPKQIVADITLSLTIYKVSYEYTTKRGNRKTGFKMLVFDRLNPSIDTKQALDKYVNDFNKDNTHRQLLNVKFLNSQCVGYIKYPN